ncbi:DNA polymerase III subunit gamma and tau, partial [Streptomyces sp. NPDC005047]
PVAEGVLPLVVRAGAGSVRDSMSVMDQLLAGAGADGVTYDMTTALLGYTDGSLLDSVVEAFVTGDGSAAFGVVDRIIEGGNDPRRFVTDLLERLRDLVILAAVPDAAEKGLIDAPADVIERMQAQARSFGAAELSRAADIVNEGLTEMRGAQSPRLQLELICARVLLPAAYGDERSVMARLDRIERGVQFSAGAGAPAMGYVPGPEAHSGGGGAVAPVAPGGGPAAARAAVRAPGGVTAPATGAGPGEGEGGGPHGGGQQPSAPAPAPAPEPPAPAPASTPTPTPAPAPAAEPGPASTPGAWPTAAPAGGGRRPGGWPTAAPAGGGQARTPAAPGPAAAPPAASAPTPAASTPAPASPPPGGGADPRSLWPNILEAVKNRRRFTWILLSQNAQVTGFDGTSLQIGFVNAGARDNFVSSGSEDVLRQALAEQFNVQWKIDAVVDPSGGSAPPPPAGPSGGHGGSGGGGGGFGGAGGSGGSGGGFGGGAPAPRPSAPAPAAPSPAAPAPDSGRSSAPSASAPRPPAPEPRQVSPEDDIPEEDDPDLDESALSGRDLLVRELGATVVEEIAHD